MTLTIVLGAAAAMLEVVAMAAMLGDPGPGGDTADFERAKGLGALLFFLIPVLTFSVMTGVHFAWRVSRRREQRHLRAQRSSEAV
jgi:hypothetical protein